MEFKDLFEQAKKNARHQERKVHEAERELNQKQQRRLERLAEEKIRQKEELRRKSLSRWPQKNSSTPIKDGNHHQRKERRVQDGTETEKISINDQTLRKERSFTIPKKAGGSSIGNSDPVLPIRNSTPKTIAQNGLPKEIMRQNNSDENAKKRGFSLTVVDQQNPLPVATKKPRVFVKPAISNDFNALMAQANKNDASAVEELIREVNVTRRRMSATPNKKLKKPEPEMGVTAGRELTYSAAIVARERAAAEQAEVERESRLKAQGYRISHDQKSNEPVAKPKLLGMKTSAGVTPKTASKSGATSANKQNLISPQQQTAKSSGVLTRETVDVAEELLSKSPMLNYKLEQQRFLNPNQRHHVAKQISVPTKKRNTTTAGGITQPEPAEKRALPPPPLTPSGAQKRYLPGDMRYKGAAATQHKKGSSPDALTQPSGVDAKGKIDSLFETVITINNSKSKTHNVVTTGKKAVAEKATVSSYPSKNSTLLSSRPVTVLQSTKASSTSSRVATQQPQRDPKKNAQVQSPQRSARELQLEEELRKEREKMARMMAMAKQAERRRPAEESIGGRKGVDSGSLARIKREAQMRREMAMAKQCNRDRLHQRQGTTASSSASSSRNKYANYSETDEDDEEDDDGYNSRRQRYDEDDDEYDSDMADFIDDSVVDDLQREDFEETLKIINPRYNKEKWLLRERMIDDKRMDSRFRDVEEEEKRSARLGLVEDILEAKRGSKALA